MQLCQSVQSKLEASVDEGHPPVLTQEELRHIEGCDDCRTLALLLRAGAEARAAHAIQPGKEAEAPLPSPEVADAVMQRVLVSVAGRAPSTGGAPREPTLAVDSPRAKSTRVTRLPLAVKIIVPAAAAALLIIMLLPQQHQPTRALARQEEKSERVAAQGSSPKELAKPARPRAGAITGPEVSKAAEEEAAFVAKGKQPPEVSPARSSSDVSDADVAVGPAAQGMDRAKDFEGGAGAGREPAKKDLMPGSFVLAGKKKTGAMVPQDLVERPGMPRADSAVAPGGKSRTDAVSATTTGRLPAVIKEKRISAPVEALRKKIERDVAVEGEESKAAVRAEARRTLGFGGVAVRSRPTPVPGGPRPRQLAEALRKARIGSDVTPGKGGGKNEAVREVRPGQHTTGEAKVAQEALTTRVARVAPGKIKKEAESAAVNMVRQEERVEVKTQAASVRGRVELLNYVAMLDSSPGRIIDAVLARSAGTVPISLQLASASGTRGSDGRNLLLRIQAGMRKPVEKLQLQVVILLVKCGGRDARGAAAALQHGMEKALASLKEGDDVLLVVPGRRKETVVSLTQPGAAGKALDAFKVSEPVSTSQLAGLLRGCLERMKSKATSARVRSLVVLLQNPQPLGKNEIILLRSAGRRLYREGISVSVIGFGSTFDPNLPLELARSAGAWFFAATHGQVLGRELSAVFTRLRATVATDIQVHLRRGAVAVADAGPARKRAAKAPAAEQVLRSPKQPAGIAQPRGAAPVDEQQQIRLRHAGLAVGEGVQYLVKVPASFVARGYAGLELRYRDPVTGVQKEVNAGLASALEKAADGDTSRVDGPVRVMRIAWELAECLDKAAHSLGKASSSGPISRLAELSRDARALSSLRGYDEMGRFAQVIDTYHNLLVRASKLQWPSDSENARMVRTVLKAAAFSLTRKAEQ